jgi:hypothetical protein
VKLGKTANDTCVVLSTGGAGMKKSSGINNSLGHKNVEGDERSCHPRYHRTYENVD